MIKVVVPVSGGKDSQACLKLAIQEHGVAHVRGLFCDTQFEHPLTYKHVDWMREHYNVQIDVRCGGNVLDEVIRNKRFPSDVARFCTDKLKIRETKLYIAELARQQGGFEVWYGMRSEESAAREKRYAGKVGDEIYAPNDVMKNYPKYLEKMGVMFRLSIIDWAEQDVFEFLNGEENPLYAMGFGRVGCFPCLAGGDGWKRVAFNFDDFGREQHRKVIKIEQEIGKSVFKSIQSKQNDLAHEPGSNGCLFCAI